MPTTRPRHVITETDAVAAALDDAAQRWPEVGHDRRRLLLRLVEEGHRSAIEQGSRETRARRASIRRTSGALSGLYGPDYLKELRADWPE